MIIQRGFPMAISVYTLAGNMGLLVRRLKSSDIVGCGRIIRAGRGKPESKVVVFPRSGMYHVFLQMAKT